MKSTNNNKKQYVNSRGEIVPRVTEVIKSLSKDQLIRWANRLGLDGVSYENEMNRTAKIGTMCHSIVEQIFRKDMIAVIDFEEYGITDKKDIKEVRNALESFFKWFKKFIKSHTYNVKFTEKVIVGEHLGGTIDCGIDGWKDPERVIFVDYKTSSGFFMTQFLQLSAYVMLYEEVYGSDTVEGVMVIRMDKHGKKAQAKFIPREDLDQFILCFQCLYDVTMGVNYLNRFTWDVTRTIE